MPTEPLPLRQAAQVLGFSESKVRRITAGGHGIVRAGGRGRGRATLYDVQAIAAIQHSATAEAAALIDRAAKCGSLGEAIADELHWADRTNELAVFGVPVHQRAAVLLYIGGRVLRRQREHLGLPDQGVPSKLAALENRRR